VTHCLGGLNQQRFQVVESVLVAWLTNSILVDPLLGMHLAWNDESKLSEIFDTDHLHAKLASVVSRLARTGWYRSEKVVGQERGRAEHQTTATDSPKPPLASRAQRTARQQHTHSPRGRGTTRARRRGKILRPSRRAGLHDTQVKFSDLAAALPVQGKLTPPTAAKFEWWEEKVRLSPAWWLASRRPYAHMTQQRAYPHTQRNG